MRNIVAGSSGMIGSRVVAMLDAPIRLDLKDGVDLRCFDDHWDSVFEGIEGNIVFDCAAPTQGIGSDEFLDVARIPMNLLASRPSKFIYCSSSCVYSDFCEVPTTEDEGILGLPESANRGYGWAKRCGELACKYSGVSCAIVRPSNIYGPSYDWSKEHKHVIPSLITQMLDGVNPLIVWGSGHQSRSFMYEEDCAALIVALSKHEGTFNLGGEEIKIGALAKMIAELVGYKGQIVFDTDKPEGPRRKVQDTTLLNRTLGSVVSTPLEEGLRKTIAAARNSRISVAAR